MTVDYRALREANVKRYGTDIGRTGRMLLADRYDRKTHFIFELLQNAEDALKRRDGWRGSRAVTFGLTEGALRFSHFGLPFTPSDVNGVCGIAESTKGLTEIGRFGIGFKSVYAVTDRPEIHSGDERFAIEDYVLPIEVCSIDKDADKTVIILPSRPNESANDPKVANAFAQLDPRVLLFLRYVDEIVWYTGERRSGHYIREDHVVFDGNAREITLSATQNGERGSVERWLVFSRSVCHDAREIGFVEVALKLDKGQIEYTSDAPLFVFFPTIVSTNMGLVIQGPFRTTPSRDNVPVDDAWNQYLVEETAALLVDTLDALRRSGRLNVGVLTCLPLHQAKFSGQFFGPIFNRVLNALREQPLLPTVTGEFAAADATRIARTQELRDLLRPPQLGELLGASSEIHWLSGEITADRAPELRQYLIRDLKVGEISPEYFISRLTKAFLETQSDEWISRLYIFLRSQPAQLARFKSLPLIRLRGGVHVPAFVHGDPQAFLPTGHESGFPTVKDAVVAVPEALEFLRSLGITEPDPVDDVVRHVVPKYQEEISVSDEEYSLDFARILQAYKTDSQAKKTRLLDQLRRSKFVRARDTGHSGYFALPSVVHLATERLTELFSDIADIYFVDTDSYSCLRGEEARDLLEACGVTRYISPHVVQLPLDYSQRATLRRGAGYENYSKETSTTDQQLRGLVALLAQLSSLEPDRRRRKAELLWDALIELLERRGQGVFSTQYRWMYYTEHSVSLDAAFVRTLQSVAWVPSNESDLRQPSEISFEQLGWTGNAFLQSKVRFRPPAIDQLAREAGFEPELLAMLRSLKLTSVEDLKLRLRVHDKGVGDDAADAPARGTMSPALPDSGSNVDERLSSGSTTQLPLRPAPAGSGAQAPTRPFISYVKVTPSDDALSDGEGSEDHAERMALEEKAIDFILKIEPRLHRTPVGNAGFDLVDQDAEGNPERWIEVKAMKGTLEARPVTLSSPQFEFARQHGEQYWLYVVENAGASAQTRLLKIQDPVGKTGSYTFDHGWIAVASIDSG